MKQQAIHKYVVSNLQKENMKNPEINYRPEP